MRSERLILAFDTSAAHCAAALLSGDRILLRRDEAMAKGQAERLMPMLDEMLAEAGVSLHDLEAIGVGTGPGNFTGTRISVAAARGLALALAIPAVGISTLEAMALGYDGALLCTLDARREMIYAQGFRGGTAASEPGLFSAESDLPWPAAKAETRVIGYRAEELAQRTGAIAAAPTFPLAEAIARAAATRLGQAASPRPAPLYIRAADAAPPADPPPAILP